MAKKKTNFDENLTNSDKEELEVIYKQNISKLQDNIQNLLDTIDEPLGDMFPEIADNVQSLENVQVYDYDREIELLKIEAKDTLECLANLYLDKKTMRKKNISSIIKNDAMYLSNLNLTISLARRSIILAMQQLDIGVPDPEMFKALAPLQKELRDSVRSAQELQRKMKDFYKEMRDELTKDTINTESEKTVDDIAIPTGNDDNLFIVSQKDLEEIKKSMKDDKDYIGLSKQ